MKNCIERMHESGMVPVFYHPDPEISKKVMGACYDAGIRVFEFTNRGENAMRVFEALNISRKNSMPDMFLGAGSVMDSETADAFIQQGADFIVAPLYSEEVNQACNEMGVPYIPGCGSVTEVGNAQQKGASLVKLFPANVLGPGFIGALLGPMPWSRIMPTGGVKPERENLKQWFDAGAYCVGMGSALFSEELVRSSAEVITAKIREVCNMIREVRNV
ncbi:bifunctional 4-hydroxy-2-oxoglutarate aldolase/2-dehydro-3-deoxy-phosphogluconate aldolase [Fulvivirga sedimenti]|uniref:Bifunctional 4-hydroxy-2-oxoglutarate aldolase/2-dehydro-3-deoxy-phosphogluconate aldolase n=1 Tax=Fulvivirga sedimenti TaxID=2879465 RepID=A0A9X1KZV0_9BACT|nr:bifunctional 4-hydroxy-2-oxoglutarate aldolase/2-dehydro-3-deoxy-phosphogluconate aldolase [Fulvivirga sedimenti]MCA6078695.1 bifunctional 4-hydroxy-2-oxoglutarate aldolase/2-dehydro-3-deoxy-phosphogluconate aldolase [Fulvivirga sedimenti]